MLAILFGAGFTTLVCFALGRLVCRTGAAILDFLSGAALLSFLLFWMVLFGLVDWRIFLAAGLSCLPFLFRRVESQASAIVPTRQARVRAPRWSRMVMAGFGVYYFIHALKPEASPDGATYHLGWVARTFRDQGFDLNPENLYWAFPKGLELLYLYAFAFGRHSAAALTHFAFLVALSAGIIAFARSQGKPLAGFVAAPLFFLSPAIALNGTTAYADVALAAACFGVFWAVELWKARGSLKMLAVAGMLAGFSFTIKYTGLVASLYLAGAVALHLYKNRQPLARPLAVALLPSILWMAPHVARNWIVFQNPVAPFANAIFPNPLVHVSFENMAREMMRHYPGLGSYWEIPWEACMRGVVLQGFLGPIFLLLPLALLSLDSPLGRRLWIAAAVLALPMAGNVGTRFLIPALPFLCLALGLVLTRWRVLAAAAIVFHGISALPPVARLYTAAGAPMLSGFPLRAALRIQPDSVSLPALAESYDVSRLIEQHVPAGATVLGLAWVMEAYTTPAIRTHHLSANNERLAETLWTPVTPELQPSKAFRFVFPQREVHGVRVVQTARSIAAAVQPGKTPGFQLNKPRVQPDIWGISEIRFGLDQSTLRPTGRWTLSAQPNRWDAGLAIDANPTTAWKTWQPARPGMLLQVDFGQATELDSVTLESPTAQARSQLLLEIQDANGNWTSLDVSPQEYATQQPENLRQLATAALKKEGIDYVAIDPTLHGAADFRDNAHLWGLHPLGAATNGVRLYYLTTPIFSRGQ